MSSNYIVRKNGLLLLMHMLLLLCIIHAASSVNWGCCSVDSCKASCSINPLTMKAACSLEITRNVKKFADLPADTQIALLKIADGDADKAKKILSCIINTEVWQPRQTCRRNL